MRDNRRYGNKERNLRKEENEQEHRKTKSRIRGEVIEIIEE